MWGNKVSNVQYMHSYGARRSMTPSGMNLVSGLSRPLLSSFTQTADLQQVTVTPVSLNHINSPFNEPRDLLYNLQTLLLGKGLHPHLLFVLSFIAFPSLNWA